MQKTTRHRPLRLTLTLCASALALSACVNTSNLDWDLRGNGGDTSNAARQATAAVPVADVNGILSYPDYQLAKARRGDTVAAMAGRLGLNGEELARVNALRVTDPLREARQILRTWSGRWMHGCADQTWPPRSRGSP